MSEPKTAVSLGFLTVVKHEPHGFFGGYLVLNASGRPLEFHCTAPIKPNRAQEILYGPTLEPYLYGEQIGQTLISKAKTQPLAVCTDQQAVLAAREMVSLPLAFIEGDDRDTSERSSPARRRIDTAHDGPVLKYFELGRNWMAVSPRHAGDEAALVDRLSGIAEHLDLREPFDRIRGAIEEAQRTIR